MNTVAEDYELDGVEQISLCLFRVGDGVFGIETRDIREVVERLEVLGVPCAPRFLAGVAAYRGEVLTMVSLRALLGMPPCEERGRVLVLSDEEAQEQFGLMVDAVDGVKTVKRSMLEENPSTVDVRERWLFEGVCKMEEGVMARLAPVRLRPLQLMKTRLFGQRGDGGWDASTDRR